MTAFSAAAAAAGTPLVKRDDVFVAIPGTLPPDVLAARLAGADAAVVMKLGRTFPKVREAAERAGVAERAIYVERASSDAERIAPLAEVEATRSPTCRSSRPDCGAVGREPARPRRLGGSLAVVGLGPAGPEWLTPEAHAELAAADDARRLRALPRARARAAWPAPARVRQPRRGRAGAPRARAGGGRRAGCGRLLRRPGHLRDGERGAGGGRGRRRRVRGRDVRVVPGLSAMQAAAARVGAPLGHDFCVISLSDQLKPWEVIERRLDAAGAADFALALYNPASRTRREQLERAREVLLRHARRDARGRRARGRRAEESVAVTTLGGLDLDPVDMRTLLIVGSSTTRVLASANGGPPRVYTPAPLPGLSGAARPRERVGDVRDRRRVGRRGGGARRSPAAPAPRRVELRDRVLAAAVLRDDDVDAVAVDQRQLASQGVRAAVEQQLVPRRHGGPGGSTQRISIGTSATPATPASPAAVEQRAAAAARRRSGGLRLLTQSQRSPRRLREPGRSRRSSGSRARGERGSGGLEDEPGQTG